MKIETQRTIVQSDEGRIIESSEVLSTIDYDVAFQSFLTTLAIDSEDNGERNSAFAYSDIAISARALELMTAIALATWHNVDGSRRRRVVSPNLEPYLHRKFRETGEGIGVHAHLNGEFLEWVGELVEKRD